MFVCLCASVCGPGFISLLQIDGGEATHPIIWPVSQCREGDHRGGEEIFTKWRLSEMCMNLCVASQSAHDDMRWDKEE